MNPIAGGRGRARVYLDGAFAFVLYKAELREFGIAEGATLSGELYAKITEEVLPARAKKRAMRLLEKRPYTERALRDKLADGEYPAEAVDAAIAYVKSYGYVNDLQYAIDHVSYHLADRNRKRLEADLLKKGIDRELIDRAFAQCYAEEDASSDAAGSARALEKQMIEKELRKKHFDPETADYETKAKLKASLVRKGFSPETVSSMVQ
ncbi:MAG: regulatory protein RecX [Lachnospiraceae bacterium]|nr:regulatory protein RecX [Lachnospiraceae bacterium]